MRRLLDRLAAAGDRTTAFGLRLLGRRRVRVAWLVVASVAAVCMLATGTIQATSVIAHEERTRVAEVSAAGLAGLHVVNEAGSTRIVGVDGADVVTVHARISEGLRDTGHQISQRDGVLSVRASCPLIGSEWCRVDYTIEVPADLALTVDAREGVTVRDTEGDVTIDVDDGSAELARLGGDVTVHVDTGDIDASDLAVQRIDASSDEDDISLAFATSPRQVAAQSDYGDIDIVLPDTPADADVRYAIDARAGAGTVTDNVREDPAADRTITADTGDGDVDIAYAAA